MPTVSANGVNYSYCQLGAGAPLVLLHGFTGSRESWWTVRDQLAAHARVTLFDLPGHGETTIPSDPSRYSFETAVDDLAQAARRTGIHRATWCGYSLGGRVALALTIRHPDLVSSLVLESGSPGISDQDARLERRRLDDELAARIELNGTAAFVDEWESLPLWKSQQRLAPEIRLIQRNIRYRNREIGLASSLRVLGQGAQPSYWSQLSEVQVPVALLTGALDTKYVDIASAMAKRLPAARVVVVPDVGHTIHLEAPALFREYVVDFMDGSKKTEPQTSVEMTA